MASVLSDHALTKGIKTKPSILQMPRRLVLSDHALTKGIKTYVVVVDPQKFLRPVGPRPD